VLLEQAIKGRLGVSLAKGNFHLSNQSIELTCGRLCCGENALGGGHLGD